MKLIYYICIVVGIIFLYGGLDTPLGEDISRAAIVGAILVTGGLTNLSIANIKERNQ